MAQTDQIRILLKFLDQHKVALLLLLSIAFSLYTHWMVLREFHMPTYGNTMIHIASARHIIEHQEYPLIDYSYGGGIPNLYVPLYRMLVAEVAILTGFSLDFTSRLLVLLFGIMVPLGFFVLGRKMFGTNAGLLAAFLSVLPGELLIYTVRPLPQALGLVLLPIAFASLYANHWKSTLFLAFAIIMTHQEAAAYIVGGTGVFFGFVIVHMIWQVLANRNFRSEKSADIMRLSLFSIFLAIAAYLIWQFMIIGHPNVLELAQFKNHEGNVVSMDSYVLKTGNIVTTFSLVGLVITFAMIIYQILKSVEITDELRNAFLTLLVFLFAAFGAYAVLTNFSMNKNISAVSLSIPFFMGPLSDLQILAISLFCGFLSVFVVKTLLRYSEVFLKLDRLSYLFLFALFFAGFVAVKNDVLGIRVFMDRFLVYLQIPLVILAALGINSLVEFLRDLPKRYLA